MDQKSFFSALEHQRIVEAIAAAEGRTSGEIRVFVSRTAAEDPVQAAQKEFHKLKMDTTALRNGVLIYIAPVSQTFAIIGDQGIHEKCGQNFWGQVAESMRAHLKEDRFTDAIVYGVTEAGHALSAHFPRQHDDQNELPNHVVEG